MLTLYTTAHDPTGRELARALQDSALAHEVVVVATDGPDHEGLPAGARPPTLIDDGRAYQGRDAVLSRLEELTAMREEWHKYGSDACYCDGEGGIV